VRTALAILEARARRFYSNYVSTFEGEFTDWEKLPPGDREFWRRRALLRLRSDESVADAIAAEEGRA